MAHKLHIIYLHPGRVKLLTRLLYTLTWGSFSRLAGFAKEIFRFSRYICLYSDILTVLLSAGKNNLIGMG